MENKEVAKHAQTDSVGCIILSFFDPPNDDQITIGGADFSSKKDMQTCWGQIHEFDSFSRFEAVITDHEGAAIEKKNVSAETCEKIMDKPIQVLLQHGRSRRKLD